MDPKMDTGMKFERKDTDLNTTLNLEQVIGILDKLLVLEVS
jgi:hypothetical protein